MISQFKMIQLKMVLFLKKLKMIITRLFQKKDKYNTLKSKKSY